MNLHEFVHWNMMSLFPRTRHDLILHTKGKQAIKCKWTRKVDENDRFKTRLVAKIYAQKKTTYKPFGVPFPT